MANSYNIYDQITAINEQSQSYATEAIQNAMNEIQKVLDLANNYYFDAPQWDTYASFKWDKLIKEALTKADLPGLKDDAFLYIDPYKDDFLEIFNMIMNTYFPDLLSFRYAETELEKIFSQGYFIKENIREQIINRARDEVTFEKNKNLEETMQAFSNRGFKNVSGFLLNKVADINKNASDKVSQINREYMIREEELYTEMYKMAIQLSLDLLPKCVEIASSFTGKYGMIYNYGSESAKVYLQGLDLMERSIAREEDEYVKRVQVAVNDIQFLNNLNLEKQNKKIQFEMQKVSFKTDLMKSSVSAYTQIGTSALQMSNSIVSLGSNLLENASSGTVTG